MTQEQLKDYISKDYSSYEIAKLTNKSQTSVRYWLNKFNLRTNKEKIGRKTSKVWSLTDKEFEEMVLNSVSIADSLGRLDMSKHPTNYTSFRKRCKILNIQPNKAKNGQFKKETILRENSTAGRSSVKAKILRENLLEYKCQICFMLPFWNGKQLGLTLDHINGNSRDHRIENLRFICPNCDRQLDTYCNKNWGLG